MLKHVLTAMLSFATPVVLAAAIANNQTVVIGNDGGTEYTFTTISIQATGADVGRPGAFFIGAVRNGQQAFYLTQSGWKAFTGARAEALAYFPALSAAVYTYHPLTGGVPQPVPVMHFPGYWIPPAVAVTVEGVTGRTTPYGIQRLEICELAGSGLIEIYAGYGALSPDKENLIRTFHSQKNPRIPADHIANTYMLNDMSKNNKVWKVISYSC